jgi:hypothetical protein
MSKYYTYAYLREDRTPYYIGKGSGRRIYSKKGRPCGRPKDKSRIIFLKQNLTEEDAFRHEKYMIAVFGRKDLGTGILYNKTNGGEGTSGFKHTEETKKKFRGNKNGRGNCGIIRTEEDKEKTRNIIKNLWKNGKYKDKKQEYKSGKENPWYGRKHTKDTIEKQKRVKCKYLYEIISPEGEIFITDNMREFCRQKNLSNRWMYAIVNGKAKTHKGWTCKRL